MSLARRLANHVSARLAALWNPSSKAEAHYLRGMAYHDQGKLEQALASLREAIRLQPFCAELHNHLGAVLSRCGRTQEAIANYHQAIRLRPNYVEAREYLAKAIANRNALEGAANLRPLGAPPACHPRNAPFASSRTATIRGVEHIYIICSPDKEPGKTAFWEKWLADNGFARGYAEIVFHKWKDELTKEDVAKYAINDGTLHHRFPYRSALRMGEVSLAINFLKSFADAAFHKYSRILLLESDAILHPRFIAILEKELEALERQDPEWGVLSLGCGLGKRPKLPTSDKHLYPSGRMRCADSLVFASRAIEFIQGCLCQVKLPIDEELEVLVASGALPCYWLEPPIVVQASQNGGCKSAIQPTSLVYVKELPWLAARPPAPAVPDICTKPRPREAGHGKWALGAYPKT